jgi:isopenicillin N synthase-like dioxygenase
MATSLDSARLPIIDLSATDRWRDHVAAQIDWASSEFGFFYVTGHGIPSSLIDSLLDLSRGFFDQDAATKQLLHMSHGGRAWRGYFPVGGELTSGRPDLKEGLYFGEELPDDDPRVRAGWSLHGKNQIPALPGFREALLAYMSELTSLSHRLMACVARGLRLDDNYFFDRYTSRPTTLFRIFNYPPITRAEEASAWGVGAHTDYGLLTILYQDEAGGLEVRHGSSWIDVPFVPGSFVVNLGDMLERLTSGRYTSALHRVRNRSARARISMPFFFDPAFDAELHPIPDVGPARTRQELLQRWDGIDLRELRGTYGEYLIGKVSKVFPELGEKLSHT